MAQVRPMSPADFAAESLPFEVRKAGKSTELHSRQTPLVQIGVCVCVGDLSPPNDETIPAAERLMNSDDTIDRRHILRAVY